MLKVMSKLGLEQLTLQYAILYDARRSYTGRPRFCGSASLAPGTSSENLMEIPAVSTRKMGCSCTAAKQTNRNW